ncbi:MAG: hypothetical protein HYZ72_18080 [Deltaproteobacteria bacterium]|nr:hypothetical protein [Deltaproteobacteria bacterium]
MLLAVLALLVGVVSAGAQDAAPPFVNRLVIEGTINPAVAEFVQESIHVSHREGARALVMQLDTPGGLLASTRVIVKAILGAPLPVIVYVAPSGASAGSAGVFITLAAHVAAMVPGTTIDAAHPVGPGGREGGGTMGEKLENFVASYGETIARQRGRNVEWAIRAVRELGASAFNRSTQPDSRPCVPPARSGSRRAHLSAKTSPQDCSWTKWGHA